MAASERPANGLYPTSAGFASPAAQNVHVFRENCLYQIFRLGSLPGKVF
jgi:hypothetical protein